MDQMWIRYILRDNVSRLSLHFLLLSHDLNTSSTTRGTWLHDIHVFVIITFSVHDEFSIVIREQVCLGAEVILREKSLHSTQIFPHEILPTYLETLREMIDLLVSGNILQVFWLCLACPHHVPF